MSWAVVGLSQKMSAIKIRAYKRRLPLGLSREKAKFCREDGRRLAE